MNITSTLVGLSIMGAAAPSMLQMSLAPFEAQKRATNLGIAESAAVVFAATYEGGIKIPENTETCVAAEREDTKNAYSVTCTHGVGKYVQSITRAFRLAVPDEQLNGGGSNASSRQFDNETPNRWSGMQCPVYDTWGVNGFNDQYYDFYGGACIPSDVWSQTAYVLSNPDAWKYDVNNYNGWGNHKDY